MTIKNSLLEIKQKLPKNITLVAVSKFQTIDKITHAIEAGQRIFGENRVQEVQSKWPEIKKFYPDIELHLIGSLQTNKVAEAVSLFDVIESLDRPKLADCLAHEMEKQNRSIPCLIQINIGNEPQKAGIAPEDTDNFIKYCQEKGLKITGLMCIPPEGENPEPYFKQMQEMARNHNFSVLSMGMSSDYETAIKFGATHVRIGTTIFGKRN